MYACTAQRKIGLLVPYFALLLDERTIGRPVFVPYFALPLDEPGVGDFFFCVYRLRGVKSGDRYSFLTLPSPWMSQGLGTFFFLRV